jgi:hypothetical protein
MKLVEQSTHGYLNYRRYEVQSQFLKGSVRFGTLTAAAVQQPEPPRRTLYFFHGGDGDDRQFVEAGLADLVAFARTEEMKIHGLQIVLPFVGASFMQGTYLSHFRDEVVPAVENGSPGHERMIGGFSLGGHVALAEFLSAPERYTTVATHYPAIFGFDFHDRTAVKNYAKQTGCNPAMLDLAIGLFRSAFPSYESYLNRSPLQLAKDTPRESLLGKRIYFDVGLNDNFGFQEGARQLSKRLFERDLSHEFHAIQGGEHDASFLKTRINDLLGFALRTGSQA